MTTIMILGAGIMQIPGIRLARRSGWKVIVADGNGEAPGRTLADHFEVVDLKDREGLLTVARRYHQRYGLHGVFTAGTDFSSSVAWVVEKMGLPGIPFETAMRATDKCLMREAFRRANVPSPRFACISRSADPLSVLGGLDFPLVVKPVDSMGARGVRRVDSTEALVDACGAALSLSHSSRAIIEEFIEGPELSLDAVVYKGKVTVCGIADRHICFPPSFVEMGHTMPTSLEAATASQVEQVFEAGIRALGIENGAAKGDIKLSPRGPIVGEIAARLSGGYMSGWTFPFSSGVEVTQAALNVAVGLPPGDLAPRFAKVVVERAFISIPGKVARIVGEKEARDLPCVKEVFVRVAPQDTVVFPTNNVEKCGNVITVADIREDAERAARTALGRISIELEPLREVTTHYLFHSSGNDAFEVTDSALLSALAATPPFRGNPRGVRPEQCVLVERIPGLVELRCHDWHGLVLSEAIRVALEGVGCLVDSPTKGGRFALCRVFWQAILRGSAQGGRFLIESVREASRHGNLSRFLSGI
jgi:biotin carboxylase